MSVPLKFDLLVENGSLTKLTHITHITHRTHRTHRTLTDMGKIARTMFFGHVVNLEDQDEMNMTEVCDTIDWEQSTEEEKGALLSLVSLMKTVAGEWEPLTDDIVFGNHDNDGQKQFTQFLDAGEMSIDMDSWEDEFACHELFAANPWEQRPVKNSMIDERQTPLLPVNKRSEVEHWTEVTKVGQTYTTCESDFGKVFVPKHMMADHKVGDMLYLKSQFKGFGSARQTALPWRALRILGTSPKIM